MNGASLVAVFRRRYGAGPLHLAGHLLAFAIIGFAFDQIFSEGDVKELLLWYVGFAIAHDLIFLPAYAGLDRLARSVLSRLPATRRRGVPVINHLRAPALISALLLILYGPLISGLSKNGYFSDSGHHLEGFLRNWVLISAALFLGSAGIYALRVGLRSVKRSDGDSG
jgi:hypothetical protein